LVVLVTAAGACIEVFPEWNRGRNFSVKVTMNGTPVQGIRVLLTPEDERRRSYETEADDKGMARFDEIQPGRYTLRAVRLGVEVSPGTINISDADSSEQIAVRWPLRSEYSVVTVAGRFQHWMLRKRDSGAGFAVSVIGPLAGAKLTLSRVDSEKRMGSVLTDSDGNFDFRSIEPGLYLLRIEEKLSSASAYPINDYLLVHVDPASARRDLRLQIDETSCGIVVRDID